MYETWFYRYILNAEWMVKGIVWLVFLLNLLMPLLLWFTIAGRRIRLPGSQKKIGMKNKTHQDS